MSESNRSFALPQTTSNTMSEMKSKKRSCPILSPSWVSWSRSMAEAKGEKPCPARIRFAKAPGRLEWRASNAGFP
ncbi:MAG: hypothetical protein BWX64_02461 [Acidobacteria bacterium ADurb.Bin051]|nr:MAG: hypothetical protein BWX64_02461 [Acidobacteria bacterium ADurb.Bin051]